MRRILFFAALWAATAPAAAQDRCREAIEGIARTPDVALASDREFSALPDAPLHPAATMFRPVQGIARNVVDFSQGASLHGMPLVMVVVADRLDLRGVVKVEHKVVIPTFPGAPPAVPSCLVLAARRLDVGPAARIRLTVLNLLTNAVVSAPDPAVENGALVAGRTPLVDVILAAQEVYLDGAPEAWREEIESWDHVARRHARIAEALGVWMAEAYPAWIDSIHDGVGRRELRSAARVAAAERRLPRLPLPPDLRSRVSELQAAFRTAAEAIPPLYTEEFSVGGIGGTATVLASTREGWTALLPSLVLFRWYERDGSPSAGLVRPGLAGSECESRLIVSGRLARDSALSLALGKRYSGAAVRWAPAAGWQPESIRMDALGLTVDRFKATGDEFESEVCVGSGPDAQLNAVRLLTTGVPSWLRWTVGSGVAQVRDSIRLSVSLAARADPPVAITAGEITNQEALPVVVEQVACADGVYPLTPRLTIPPGQTAPLPGALKSANSCEVPPGGVRSQIAGGQWQRAFFVVPPTATPTIVTVVNSIGPELGGGRILLYLELDVDARITANGSPEWTRLRLRSIQLTPAGAPGSTAYASLYFAGSALPVFRITGRAHLTDGSELAVCVPPTAEISISIDADDLYSGGCPPE